MVSSGALRVVFFGTPRFAVPTLERLRASRHTVAAVVTQPDRPRGRGQKVTDAPVKALALDTAIPILQPTTLKDDGFLAELGALEADIGVVAAYGRILPTAVLQAPRLGMINVHASLLPKYRGAAPVHRAVIAGERHTGVTIMRVVEALDAGPMLALGQRAIRDDETSEDIERDLAIIGASLLVETVDRLGAGPIAETPQDDAQATYAPRLTREDGRIDWSQSASALHNLVRGLHPWPHAYATLNGRRVIIRRARSASHPSGGVPGTVLVGQGDDLIVAVGDGALALLDVQLEGKRPMTAREFLAGHRVTPGDRFVTAT